MDLWTLALRNRNTEWGRAVVLLLLMAAYMRDGAGPPHPGWSPPQNQRARSRRRSHASLTGRRPRG